MRRKKKKRRARRVRVGGVEGFSWPFATAASFAHLLGTFFSSKVAK